MKTKAPEKIYLNPLLMEDGESVVRLRTFERQRDSQIEYTRTDAFIEKACDYLMKYEFNDSPTIADRRKRVEEFRKYMKGE